MFCRSCGQPNDETAGQCSRCGQPLVPVPAVPGVPPPTLPNYLGQAILVTVFCCLPFGIPAIVYAAQVNPKLAGGDYAGAMESSQKAKKWTWISFGVGAVWVVVYGGFVLVSVL